MPTNRPCAHCGKDFAPRTTCKDKQGVRQKYCSAPCRRRSAKHMAEGRNGEQRSQCSACSQAFTYRSASDRKRRFCSAPECQATRLRTLAGGTAMCVSEGCPNERVYRSGLCNSCYYRKRRTGTTDRRVYAYRSRHSSGYVCIQQSDHPMSVNGHVFEHRKVLYDAIGPGPHPCHWCQRLVDWIKGKCVDGAVVPDHLDGDKANNALTNLVPSCNPCNSRRGMLMKWVQAHKDDPILWAMYEEARKQSA